MIRLAPEELAWSPGESEKKRVERTGNYRLTK